MGNQAGCGGLHSHHGGMFLCLDEYQKAKFSRPDRVHKSSGSSSGQKAAVQRIEELLREFFQQLDLNKNGKLEEAELVQLNVKIQMLHRGNEIDRAAVKREFTDCFRDRFDPEGRPVGYEVFREKMLQQLRDLDETAVAQEMILDQWVEEVKSARAVFASHTMRSEADLQFLSKLSCGVYPSTTEEYPPCPPVDSIPHPAHAQGPLADPMDSCAPYPDVAQILRGQAPPADSVDSFVPHPMNAQILRDGPPSQPPASYALHYPCAEDGPPNMSVDSFVPCPQHTQDCPPNMSVDSFVPCPQHTQGPPNMSVDSFVPSPQHMEVLPNMSIDSFVPCPQRAQDPPNASIDSFIPRPRDSQDPPNASIDSFVPRPRDSQEPPNASVDSFVPRPRDPQGLAAGAFGCPASYQNGTTGGAGTEAEIEYPSDAGQFVLEPEETTPFDSDFVLIRPSERQSSGSGTTHLSTQEAYPSLYKSQTFDSDFIPSSPQRGSASTPGRSGSSPAAGGEVGIGTDDPGFSKGEVVQVWSKSKKAWFNGTVQEAYADAASVDGFSVPAGTVKVASAAGEKYVLPSEVASTLRKGCGAPGRPPAAAAGPPPAAGLPPALTHSVTPKFKQDSHVQVWSETSKAWLAGVVLETFSNAEQRGELLIPAGTLVVRSAVGVKWVRPEQAAGLLREPVAAARGADRVPEGPRLGQRPVPRFGSALPPVSEEATSSFLKGEKVQVWCDDKHLWLGGVVFEAPSSYSSGTSDGGNAFGMPGGKPMVKVLVADGRERVLVGDDIRRCLRKASLGGSAASTAQLKAKLGAVLQGPGALRKHVDAVWVEHQRTQAARGGPEGLAKDRAAWALEGLASQFDIRLDLEGQYLAAIAQRFDAFDRRGTGLLSHAEFQDLCRELIAEVYSSL